MKTYRVIVDNEAVSDLNSVSAYVAGLYRPESGQNMLAESSENWLRLALPQTFTHTVVMPLQKQYILKPKHYPSSTISGPWSFMYLEALFLWIA